MELTGVKSSHEEIQTMNMLRDALASFAARKSKVREYEILRVIGEIQGTDTKTSLVNARKEILAWVQKRSGGRLPEIAWDCQGFQYLTGGRNSVAVRIKGKKADIWAIRADDPDKTVAGRIWTNEIVIGIQSGQKPIFSVRQLVSTSEEEFNVDPHVPGCVRQLSDKIGIKYNGLSFCPDPIIINSSEQLDWLVDVLIDHNRKVPFFVLSVPSISEDKKTPLINAFELSRSTLGLAVTAITTHECSWGLTSKLGKQRSVYNGAVRVYLPGFTDDSNPYDHKLVLADQLSTPEGLAQCLRWMKTLAADESIRRTRLGKDVIAFATIQNESLQINQKKLEQSGASDNDKLDAANARIKALENNVRSQNDQLDYFADEHEKAEDRAKAAEGLAKASAFRIQQLLDQLKKIGAQPDSNITFPSGWNDFGNWCDQNLSGRLILSSAARRSVRSPMYEDCQLAARCLLWLANDCRDSFLGRNEIVLRDATIESGVRNAPCGGDEYETKWTNQRYKVEWHIKNGGNTRDPTRCLRIYYFWDPVSQQIIVDEMPAHKETRAS